MTIDIIKEARGFALCERADGKRTVIEIDRDRGQVYSVMPGDKPANGGRWFARLSDAGIRYVANFYSRSYADRVFRGCVAESVDAAISGE